MRFQWPIAANIGRREHVMTVLIIGLVLVAIGGIWFSDVLSDLDSL